MNCKNLETPQTINPQATRCEHGVIIVNPEHHAAWCSGCGDWRFEGVQQAAKWNAASLSKATIDSFKGDPTKKTIPHVRRKDKPDVKIVTHSPALIIDGMTTHERWLSVGEWKPRRKQQTQVITNPWADMSRFQPPPILQARPTRTVILVSPIPTTIPYNTVSKFRTLVPDIEWQSRTAGRMLDRAFGQYTRTSLDKHFVVDAYWATEINDDGDDTSPYEPTQSLTMKPPPLDGVGQINMEPEIRIETVVLSGGSPARSYIESDIPHHRSEDLHVLPSDFKEKKLGIKDRVGAFVLSEVLKAMKDFDADEPESNGTRDARLAKFIRQRYKTSFVAPKDAGMEEFALPEHREDAVTARLREITAKQVRTMRERLSALGIYRSNSAPASDTEF